MLDTYKKYGWVVKEGEEQRLGSVADMYLEFTNEDGYKKVLIIDDGNIPDAFKYYHIYVLGSNDDGSVQYEWDGKIFEGAIENSSEFELLMKMLGFVAQ